MTSSPSRGAKFRVPEMIRRLLLVAMALVAVVCAGVALPGRTIAHVAAASFTAAAADSAPAAREPSAPKATHQWRAGAVRSADRVAIEGTLEDDDFDDARRDVSEAPAVTLGRASLPRAPGQPSAREPRVDALRFVIGRGLPRAPPA